VYFGQYDHTIDAKGRVSVPALWRDQLLGDLRLVLAPFTVSGERCIDVYPFAEWSKLLERFSTLPRFNAKAIKFQMGYLGRSHPCDVDPAGRILVPPPLRKHAELEKDVVFVGVNTMFRLMDSGKFAKVVSGHDAEAALDTGTGMYEDLGL
jgi:transcriptional regulator MraZ